MDDFSPMTDALADKADAERKRDKEEPGWRDPVFVPGDELANFLCQVIEHFQNREKTLWAHLVQRRKQAIREYLLAHEVAPWYELTKAMVVEEEA